MLAGCIEAPPEAPAPAPAAPLFTDVAAATGLAFVHQNGMTGARYFVEMTGAGAAFFDYDGDGDLDVYLVQGGPIEPGASPRPGDRLFRNDLVPGPDGVPSLRFVDVTEASGLRATGYGMGVATGDVDGDGWTDLYLTNWGPNQLWRNNGDGTFTDRTDPATTGDPRWSTSASFLDYDRDGDLDLMTVNYVEYRLANEHPCFATRSGRRDYCGPQSYAPTPDRLLRNRGDGTFDEVTVAMGMAATFGPGLGVVSADFDEDGWPDLYVANDGAENQLWMNEAGRRFADRALPAGVAVNMSGSPEASMGVVAADLDGQGRDDLFMTHLNGETNTLYVNRGGGLFEDRSRPTGLGQPSWPYTAFGTAALDYDLDGGLDLFVANGEVRSIPAQADAGEPLPLRQPNQLFHQRGAGQFEAVGGWSPDADRAEVSRGLAVGDVDNDGDPDVLITNNNGPARLYLNHAGNGAAWLGLRLVDEAGRDVPGTRATLRRTDGTALHRRSHTDGSYGSAHDPRVVFGLGTDTAFDRLDIRWPDGHTEAWTDLALHRYHTLRRGEGL